MVNKYPEDEFDRLAAERATRGAHRRTRNVRPWLLSLIAVLILAPLIGLGIGSLMSGRDTDPQAGETTATQTSDSGQPANDGEADTTGDGADGEGADGDGTNGDGTTGDADGRCMMRSPLGSIAVLYCVISCQFLGAANCSLSAYYSSLVYFSINFLQKYE